MQTPTRIFCFLILSAYGIQNAHLISRCSWVEMLKKTCKDRKADVNCVQLLQYCIWLHFFQYLYKFVETGLICLGFVCLGFLIDWLIDCFWLFVWCFVCLFCFFPSSCCRSQGGKKEIMYGNVICYIRCHLWPLHYKQISPTYRCWLPGCHEECRDYNLVMKVVESGKSDRYVSLDYKCLCHYVQCKCRICIIICMATPNYVYSSSYFLVNSQVISKTLCSWQKSSS